MNQLMPLIGGPAHGTWQQMPAKDGELVQCGTIFYIVHSATPKCFSEPLHFAIAEGCARPASLRDELVDVYKHGRMLLKPE